MLGGEYFDSDADKQYVYGDLFIYNCDRNKWRKVMIPHRCVAPPLYHRGFPDFTTCCNRALAILYHFPHQRIL